MTGPADALRKVTDSGVPAFPKTPLRIVLGGAFGLIAVMAVQSLIEAAAKDWRLMAASIAISVGGWAAMVLAIWLLACVGGLVRGQGPVSPPFWTGGWRDVAVKLLWIILFVVQAGPRISHALTSGDWSDVRWLCIVMGAAASLVGIGLAFGNGRKLVGDN